MNKPFANQEILLRDNRTVTLRAVVSDDVECFLGFFAGLSAQSKDFMHGWSAVGGQEHAEGMVGKMASADHIAIVAVTPNGCIVGYCWLDGLESADMPMLGIGIIDEFHEAGLGRVLLRAMIGQAGAMGYPRVRLGVWTDNARAMHVYRAVGFVDDPIMPAKDFDGRTELYMVMETGGDG